MIVFWIFRKRNLGVEPGLRVRLLDNGPDLLVVLMLRGISRLTVGIIGMRPQRSWRKIILLCHFCHVYHVQTFSEFGNVCSLQMMLPGPEHFLGQRAASGNLRLWFTVGKGPKSSSISGMCPPLLVTTRTPLPSCDNGWSKLNWAPFYQIGLFTFCSFF